MAVHAAKAFRPEMGDRILGAIRRCVADAHDVGVTAVALLRPGSIPRTSSGKIQRYLCREAFEAGTLDAIGIWPARMQVPWHVSW